MKILSSCKSISCVFLMIRILMCLFFFIFQDRVSLVLLSWNSLCRPGWPQTQRSSCLCLSSTGIKGIYHHCPVAFFFFFFSILFLVKEQMSSLIFWKLEWKLGCKLETPWSWWYVIFFCALKSLFLHIRSASSDMLSTNFRCSNIKAVSVSVLSLWRDTRNKATFIKGSI